MRRPGRLIITLLLTMLLGLSFKVLAQSDSKIMQQLVESYDLLEAGNLDQAKARFQEILRQDPGNPLALNNLGYIAVKEKKYEEALKDLEQALPRAKGYKIKINRVCDVDGICLAFRPLQEVYGEQDLAPLVQLNLEMVRARLATRK
ncbi:MAG: tetratricopeptide repeat protein [Deltaproteobacteria bacterium]|nr:tetratricopeptide repeat protein [Deltaproteobacteria bacterium]